MTPVDPAPRTWSALTALGLAAAVFVAGEPLVLDMPAFGAGYVLRRLALALALGLLLLMAAWLPSRLGRMPKAYLPWLLAPVGIVLLGLLTQSGAGPRNAIRHGLVWTGLGLLPLALARAFEVPRFARRTWLVLLGLAGILCLLGLVERFSGGRMAASFGRPAVAGAVFAALIMPALLLVTPRRLGVGLALLLGVTCVLTGSRAAIVAAVFGTLAAASLAATNPVHRRRLVLGGAGLAATVVLAFGLGLNGTLPFPGNRRTVAVRMGLHRASLDLIAERPLTGQGLGRYAPEVMRLRDPAEARLEPGRRPEQAHLDLLHASTEGGVGAGLLLLAWLLGAFVLLQRRRAEAEGPVARRHVAAMGGVLMTLAVAGLADGVLVDPAPVLLAALAVASILTLAPRRELPVRLAAAPRGLALLLGLGVLGGAFCLSLDARADHALQGYVNARVATRLAHAAPGSPADREARLRTLDQRFEGLARALRYRADSAEIEYQRGVHLVERSPSITSDAASAFRRAFEIDPGKTEARLNLARLYELDGRMDDARAVLREATRRDPTRFDTWMRLGHLTVGPEPIPGDPPPADTDWVAALKNYNRAHAMAPNRFEFDVAIARMDRRKARTPEALKAIDLRLEQVAGRFARDGATPLEKLAQAPAEVIVEAFRVAEQMGTGDALPNAILRLALRRDRDVAIGMRREVDRILAEALRREEAARERVGSSKNPREFDSAERAYTAAAIRLAALLQEGGLDLPDQLDQARGEKELKRFRMSLARYRGLLAATSEVNAADVLGGNPAAGLAWRSELLREAAGVASRVDGGLARTYWSRGFTLTGLLHIRANELDRALIALRRAIDYDSDLSDAHYQLARVFARRAEMDDASKTLLRALELGPHWKVHAIRDPDFAGLRKRPEIQRALRQ